ncbi:MAG: hypothetical protein KDK91_30230 [Gammaproteobacteria bacterium]|nr:hypothetical protein [Gammaproteobacteria bacterium]
MSEQRSVDELRPVAVMVMPFRKRTVTGALDGAPAHIDFDALWDKAFAPALDELGYLPVRADTELGSVIVKDMFERLALAELVIADLSLPNGNVYYEVGLRHAFRQSHCVLVAAEWSRQLFDVDQIRTERYALHDGDVPDEEAARIRDWLRAAVTVKKDSPSPFHELVKDKSQSTVFRDQLERLNQFQTRVRAIRLRKDRSAQAQAVRELLRSHTGAALQLPEVAAELVTLVRDGLGWAALVDYVQDLPETLRGSDFTREQVLLAQAELGDPELAIEGLKSLIELRGDSAERQGLLGGRYKRLWRQSRDARLASAQASADALPGLEELAHLDSAIEHYTRGAQLDLNGYFCACNLPELLRARGRPGDLEEAAYQDQHTVRACRRAIERGEDDGWARRTLLGAAFRARELAQVQALALEVARQGPAAWQLETTLADINQSIAGVDDPALRQQLGAVRDQLAALR